MDIDHTQSGEGTAGASAGELSTRATLDAQTRNANGADWQEEVYQKIKSMKEMYLSELNDLYQKIASKVQQHDSLPQRPQNEQIEKLKMFKMTLERIVLFLRLNKHDIQLIHKEKLLSVEKHISFFLRSNRQCSKPSSSPLQGQLPQSSMQLQQPQSLDGQTNPSMQPVQGSMSAMQQNNLNNLQHNSLSGIPTISNSQQHMLNTVQPGSSVDLGQGNSLNSRQQVATGFLRHNPVNSPQQVNISSLSSQSGTNPVQENLGSLQQNSNALQQSLPKQHKQQMLQNQQSVPSCNQLLMQQQLMQQQLMQQQIVQLRTHQISQLHQMTDANDLKMRQQMGMNTGVLQQQQSIGRSVGSHHPQLRSAISSPQVHQAPSPQNSLTNLQHNSLSGVSTNSLSGVSTISNSPQHMINIVQPGSSLDLGQVTLNSLQEVATGSLQQNPVNSPQQVNISSLSSQSGTNPVQENLGSLQQNPNALQMLQNQQLTRQCNQLLMQKVLFRRQQLMQQQQAMNSRQQLMQQNDLTNLQNNSLSGLSTVSNSQQHMINMVQPGSSLDLGQGNSLNPWQQVATGSLQQNPVNSPQVNISSLSSQSGTNPVQANLGSLQQNSSVLQQMLQTQQLRQQYHQLQMQQQLFQRQQLMQLQQALRQQTALLPNPQMSQLHQMRQQMGMKTGVLQQQLLALQQQMGMKTGVLQQQQSVGQCVGSHHSQLKSGISSPQLHQALSPQLKEKGKVEGDVTLQMEFEPYAATVEGTEISPTPLDSTAQTGNASGADWHEEVYQKAQNKYTLQTPLLGSGPQDMASDDLDYEGMVMIVSVLLLLVLIGLVLLLKD